MTEQVQYVQRMQEIKECAVKQFSRLTGIDETKVVETMVIRAVHEDFDWIEFECKGNFFHYTRGKDSLTCVLSETD